MNLDSTSDLNAKIAKRFQSKVYAGLEIAKNNVSV